MKKLILGMMIMAGLMVGTAHAQNKIPNVHFELSFRMLEEGKLSENFHLFELWCSDGRCDLTLLTLNQCIGDRSFPKVETSSTGILAGQGKEPTLRVKHTVNNVLELEQDIDFDGKMSFYIQYKIAQTETEKHQTHNRLFTHSNENPVKRLVITSFKGGFTKYSSTLNKIVSVEYVPITEEYTVIKLDCGVLIPGTVSLKKQK
jgi:hypothetical protein